MPGRGASSVIGPCDRVVGGYRHARHPDRQPHPRQRRPAGASPGPGVRQDPRVLASRRGPAEQPQPPGRRVSGSCASSAPSRGGGDCRGCSPRHRRALTTQVSPSALEPPAGTGSRQPRHRERPACPGETTRAARCHGPTAVTTTTRTARRHDAINLEPATQNRRIWRRPACIYRPRQRSKESAICTELTMPRAAGSMRGQQPRQPAPHQRLVRR